MSIEQTHSQGTHAGSDHSKRPYMTVFWALLVLTLIEVSSIFLPPDTIPKVVVVVFLLSLAVSKAALVAMYYMHLRYDPRSLAVVFVGPFGLAFLFALIILFQY